MFNEEKNKLDQVKELELDQVKHRIPEFLDYSPNESFFPVFIDFRNGG